MRTSPLHRHAVAALFTVALSSATLGCASKVKRDFDAEASALNPLIDTATTKYLLFLQSLENAEKRMANDHVVKDAKRAVEGRDPREADLVAALEAIHDELPPNQNAFFDRARESLEALSDACGCGPTTGDVCGRECGGAIDDAVAAVNGIAAESRRVGSTIHALGKDPLR